MPIVTEGRLDQKIEQGKLFYFIFDRTALVQNDTIDIVFETSDNVTTVEMIEVTASAENFEWEIYANTTYQAATGTVISPIPRNLNIGGGADITITDTPTITSNGTLIAGPQEIIGVALNGSGARARLESEIINLQQVLAKNSSYMVRIKNLDTQDRRVAVNIITTKY